MFIETPLKHHEYNDNISTVTIKVDNITALEFDGSLGLFVLVNTGDRYLVADSEAFLKKLKAWSDYCYA